MADLPSLLIGWLLGLLSPRIVEVIRAKYLRRDLARAIRSEAEDLQYRVAITSFLLVQKYGHLSREYLVWVKPKLSCYEGNEPVQSVRELVEQLQAAPADQLLAVAAHMRAEEGMGLSLKKFSACLIEASLGSLLHFSPEYQRCVHEFRNHLSVLNQEIDRAVESLRMTYDSSISNENHIRLKADLVSKYQIIQGMCMRVADRLQAIINYDLKKI